MEGYRHLTEWLQDIIEAVYDMRDAVRRLEAGECAPDQAGEAFARRRALLLEREREAGVFLPAAYVRECYGLKDSGMGELLYWLLLLSLAMEADPGLCLEYRQRFGGGTPDFQYGLHQLSAVMPVDSGILALFCDREGELWQLFDLREREGYLLQQPMKLRREALFFLLTGRFPVDADSPLAQMTRTDKALPLYEDAAGELKRFLRAGELDRAALWGRRGTGKRTLLAALCGEEQLMGLLIELGRMEGWEEERRSAFRLSVLFRLRLADCVAVLSFRGVKWEEGTWERLEREWKPYLGSCRLVFLAEEERELALCRREAQTVITLPDHLNGRERRLALGAFSPPEGPEAWQEELVGRYRMSAGELLRCLERIRLSAGLRQVSLDDRALWTEGLKEGRLENPLGSEVLTRCVMEDFVGGEDCREQLETVVRLAGGWRSGIERLRETGEELPEGLLLLFHGPSGTGKTMSASILANELGMSLVRVDLAQVFDKYIGETEKHLEEIFRSAERSNDILFFDEADALFSKRTQIGDSHDKYANVSTSFLLQRIEAYPGILILATNLIHHFDDAFLRRIRCVVRFQEPDAAQRALLWEKALAGGESPFPYELLAEAVRFSPARIKAAALVAKQLAFSEGLGSPGPSQLERAIRMEARKDNTAVGSLSEILRQEGLSAEPSAREGSLRPRSLSAGV